jgi:hypothetical protein
MNIEEMKEIFIAGGAPFVANKANLLVYRSLSGIEKDLINDKILINDKSGTVHEFICTANGGKWATLNIKSEDWEKYNCNLDEDGNKITVCGGAHFPSGWTGEIWRAGLHHQEYPALIQFRKARTFADMGSFDRKNWVKLYSNGLQNIHYMTGANGLIGQGSYGCIAIRDEFKGNGPWAKFYEAWESFINAKNFYYGAYIIDI